MCVGMGVGEGRGGFGEEVGVAVLDVLGEHVSKFLNYRYSKMGFLVGWNLVEDNAVFDVVF